MSDTKEYIINKSYELFLTHNYEAVSISDISKAIGFTKGALYHHFLNKEELFMAVVDKYLILPQVTCDLQATTFKEYIDLSIVEMRKIMDIYLGFSSDFNPLNHIALFIDASRNYPGFRERKETYINKETKNSEIIIENSIKRGELRDDINVSITASNLTALCMGFAGNMLLNTNSPEDAYELLKKQLLEYYKILKK